MLLTALLEHRVTIRITRVLGITPSLDEPVFKPLRIGGLSLLFPVRNMAFPEQKVRSFNKFETIRTCVWRVLPSFVREYCPEVGF